jgi:pimeloyl-ACP methyl ester carboxylesterase
VTESRFLEANGLRLHYLESGDGPPLVLVPGLTANAHSFDGLLAAGLDARLRVLAFDARGRGLSDRPASGYTMDDHATDLLAALAVLGLDRVILGGHSFGGLLTFFVAAQHPERVEKAVVIDAPSEIDPAILDQIAPSLARLERTFASWEEYDELIRAFPYWDGFEWNDQVQAYYRGDAEQIAEGEIRARARPAAIQAVIAGELAVDWPATVARVACPTLLIRATGSFGPAGSGPILDGDGARRTLSLLRDGRLVELDGNHVTVMFGPSAGRMVREITAFVGQ